MATYFIPEKYIPGFRLISRLTANDITLLGEVFSNFEVGETFQTVIATAKKKIDTLTENEINQVTRALVSIVNIFEEADRNIDAFVFDFSKALTLSTPDISEDEVNNFKTNLSKLLSVYDKIRITSKAQYLIQENINNLSSAKIISDIRLVFDSDLEDSKKFAVLVHNMKLEYRKDNKIKSFIISMDYSDLIEMKKVIERAIEKDRIIRENKHDFTVIDIK